MNGEVKENSNANKEDTDKFVHFGRVSQEFGYVDHFVMDQQAYKYNQNCKEKYIDREINQIKKRSLRRI